MPCKTFALFGKRDNFDAPGETSCPIAGSPTGVGAKGDKGLPTRIAIAEVKRMEYWSLLAE